MTFSWFILSRNLPGGCFWLSVSKCLGTLWSRGLRGVAQPEAGGNTVPEAQQSLAEWHLCHFWGWAGCCHSWQLGSCAPLSSASPCPWMSAHPRAECLFPGLAAGEVSSPACGNILFVHLQEGLSIAVWGFQMENGLES